MFNLASYTAAVGMLYIKKTIILIYIYIHTQTRDQKNISNKFKMAIKTASSGDLSPYAQF